MSRKVMLITALLVLGVAFAAFAQLANVHSKWIKGSLVYYQDNEKRLIDAIGNNVVKYISDYVTLAVDDTTGDATEFTTTVVEVGAGTSTTTQLDGSGGALLLTCAGNEDDGPSLQLNGESFEVTTDQVLYVGFFDVTINDVTQTDFFLGLAVTDTAILGGVTHRIGFESLDGSTDLKFMLEKANTETLTASLATLEDATAIDLEFYYDGATVEVFVDGASVATPAVTNIPDDEALRLSLELLTGEAVANTLSVDTIRVIQLVR